MGIFKVTFLSLLCLCCMLGTALCARSLAADPIRSSLNSSSGAGMPERGSVEVSRGRVPLQPLGSSQLRTSLSNMEGENGSESRRLSEYQTFNAIDRCWRGNANWESNRRQLANCVTGFGSLASGGTSGQNYLVTDPGDDAVDPAPGTLRYGVTQLTPLWITFAGDMTIQLDNELIVASDKTIDGRGANVHIANGPCITIQDVQNVVVHGLNIHDCKPGSSGMVRSSVAHVGERIGSDGDGITVINSQNVWIDHNSLSSCYDGLVDVIHGSTGVTISNNYFSDHDKVMLLGHDDGYTADKNMKVTVTNNVFGPNLMQRMPRCRLGVFHVLNNEYQSWGIYAVGGSADPTIISQGNRYSAGGEKQVTKRDCNCGTTTWSDWLWTSVDDSFTNGAYFVESGQGAGTKIVSDIGLLSVSEKHMPYMTSSAGALSCMPGLPC